MLYVRGSFKTQNLPSSFDEFSYMMNKYKFDIVALSETWVKNNKTQLYRSVVINLNSKIESKSGGGVDFYIKEHMNFNVRHNLGKIDESNEGL